MYGNKSAKEKLLEGLMEMSSENGGGSFGKSRLKPIWIETSKLVPAKGGRQFADPDKLKALGAFDWHKYKPLTIELDRKGIYRIQDGMTRLEAARRAGITRLLVYLFKE